MAGHAQISADVLGSYVADAARDVEGVHGIVEGPLARGKGVRVTGDEGGVAAELHVSLDWGASVPEVGAAIQQRVVEFLERMADVRPVSVDVVVDEICPPVVGR